MRAKAEAAVQQAMEKRRIEAEAEACVHCAAPPSRANPPLRTVLGTPLQARAAAERVAVLEAQAAAARQAALEAAKAAEEMMAAAAAQSKEAAQARQAAETMVKQA